MKSDRHKTPLIVTAASERQARTLSQLLLSAERHDAHRNGKWIVQDLGLSPVDREFIALRFPWVKRLQQPHLFSPGAARGGSIPLMLGEAACGHDGPVFWLDCAAILRAPLDALLAKLEERGFWGLRVPGTLPDICTMDLFDACEVPLEVRHVPGWHGGALGFDTRHPVGKGLLEDWIAAQGGQADAATLNCLLAKAVYTAALNPDAADTVVRWAQPCAAISTDNPVPQWIPLWADPAVRAWHAAGKAVKRLYHRLRHFDDTRIDGFNRRRTEHFSVKIRHVGETFATSIPSPPNGYFADPFVRVRDGKTWLFAEQFQYREDRGHLSVMGLDAKGAITSVEALAFTPAYAALDCHASYPFVFEHDGVAYMIPETHEHRAIDLFVCERWPDRWQLSRRLLFGIDAVDSMVIQHEGSWFLLTSVKGGWPNRHLEIHCMENLLEAPLTAHPINTLGLYGERANGTGRNAGFLGPQQDGTLMRLMQDSPHYYGEGLRPMRILELTRATFHEEPASFIDLFPGFGPDTSSHHVSRAGDIIAWDVRDRMRSRHRTKNWKRNRLSRRG
ncbi:glucosamine inositolphosphorylceramide transferase family protein [Aestuariivirga sp.]|uniref:glucosamine inositolphosphorylceramide transferase family protein n=1 Tax=Aestuariivirga sp. TaxID=2650926 RepID=UPI003BAC2A4B